MNEAELGFELKNALAHIEALEAELTLTKNQRNEGGEMIFELVARIEKLEDILREISIYNDNITKTIRALEPEQTK